MNNERIPNNFSSWLPHKGNALFTLLVVGAMLWLQTAGVITGFAPAPTSSATSNNIINYQGYLADSDGNPVNGNIDMTFRIYNTATGGTPLWEETWASNNSVIVNDGLFSVSLGGISTTLTQVVQDQADLYLEIVVGSIEVAPRSQLGSSISSIQTVNVQENSIETEHLANGSVTNAKVALSEFLITSSLSDHTLLTNNYTTIGEANVTLSYDADLLILITYEGYGGRTIARVADSAGKTLCALSHYSTSTDTGFKMCFYRGVTQGVQTFHYEARTAESGTQHVRSGSNVMIIPLAQSIP